MDSSISYLDGAELLNRMTAAQAAAREYEGEGAVINERYNKNEYQTRRFHFLGHRQGRGFRVYPTAAADADIVFDSQPVNLSVQAVRRRELTCNLDPLLPLPTRQNCDTLTDYDEYPSQEWKEGDPPTFPRDHQDSSGPPSPTISEQAQNALPQAPQPLPNQQTTNLFPPAPPGTINPRLLTTVGMAPAGLLNPPSPETLSNVIYALNFPIGTMPRPPKYRAEDGVAALSGRGISVPVKTPPKSNGKKRSSEHLESDDDDQAIDLEAAAPSEISRPQERPRKKGKHLRAPDADQAPRAPRPAVSKGKQRSGDAGKSRAVSLAPSTHRATKAPRPAGSQTRAASEKLASKANLTWPACVSGSRIAKNMREAQEAAVERKQVLVEAHMLKHPTERNVDFPPEFFNTYNFTDDERANIGSDNGPIRCVCGEGEVAGKLDWIQCDAQDCGVWQHVECMGEAVPEDTKKREAAKYLCQVCDPWKHRRTIQKLRRMNPDPILAVAKRERTDDDE